MFRITKKIIIAAGMLAFCSGQFNAFGSETDEILEGKPRSPFVIANTEDSDPTTINHMKAMRSILKEASKDTNPRSLATICKYWHSIMREKNVPQGELHYSTMNPFMKECM